MDYCYKAICTRVIDGDTCEFLIQLGFGVMKKDRFRTLGINTPETYGVKKTSIEYQLGSLAKEWLKARIEGKEVIIKTHKDKQGKYGRYLCEIFLDEVNIGELMVTEGLAERYQ